MVKRQGMKAAKVLLSVLGVTWLTGCGALSNWMAKREPTILPAQPLVMGDKETATIPFMFEFVPDDGWRFDEGGGGSGTIVISRERLTVQSIKHSLPKPGKDLDRNRWVRFEDLDGDGWQDVILPTDVAADTGVPVTVVYRFNPEKAKFEFVETLSYWGDVRAAGAACVEMRYAQDTLPPAFGHYCYSAQVGRWIPRMPALVADDDADSACRDASAKARACRQARLALDRALLVLWNDYRLGRLALLRRSSGRASAGQFARASELSHGAWLTYRDTRCATQVREQALPARFVQSAIEACKHGMGLQQMRYYRSQEARLQIIAAVG